MPDATTLTTAVERLVEAVGAVRLPLPLPGRDEAATAQRRLVDQVRDHLLPRLADRDAPLLVVVGGSTGAGKSTLVNTLVGEVVSETGVLRPTTRSPVLVHNPADLEAFAGDRVLPSLARATGRQGTSPDVVTLVAHDAVPAGLALLDAPDVDSVADENRELARQLLDAADLWLFATTPSRYADAVPWELLRTAANRGTAVAVVLGRVEDADRDAVTTHLRQMLDDAGLGDAALLTVAASVTTGDRLPGTVVAEVAAHLRAIAGDDQRRRSIADRTLRGALDAVVDRATTVRAAATAQLDAADDLCARAESSHAHASATVLDAIEDGRVLRGEVLARWHDFVGAGDLLRRLEEGVGRLRDRVTSLWRGPRTTDEQLTEALGDGLLAVVTDALERAHDDTLRAWRAGPGATLLDGDVTPVRTRAGHVRTEVQRWQDEVVDLVRGQAGDKRAAARMVALGLNGAAAALMVAVFASTQGLTGAEVGIAGGTSVVAQRLLEAILGDQAVRSLTDQARDALLRRVEALVADQRDRFVEQVDALDLDRDLPGAIDTAVAAVADARTTAAL